MSKANAKHATGWPRFFFARVFARQFWNRLLPAIAKHVDVCPTIATYGASQLSSSISFALSILSLHESTLSKRTPL